ncbi:MAG: LytR C-terminal domain-containing protein [Bacteroidota bacterium]
MTKKNTKKLAVKDSTANIFLNVTIVLLGILILYMSYSIVSKVVKGRGEEKSEVNTSVASNIIQVEVLNGCGVSGVGDRFTDFLRNRKIDVVNVSNYTSFDVEKTMVIDRTGNMANAQRVAEMLGISQPNIIQQLNDDYFLEVSLIIGKDFKKLKPFNN